MGVDLFLTVGSQMPFDRLTAAVAHWVREQQRVATNFDARAQVGTTQLDETALRGLRWSRLMSPADYLLHCRHARVLVAHAGMGSVLTAMDLGIPMVLMPRRATLGETRSDHQLDTARHLQRHWQGPPLRIAWDEHEVPDALDAALQGHWPPPLAFAHRVGHEGPNRTAGRPELIAHLRGLINLQRR